MFSLQGWELSHGQFTQEELSLRDALPQQLSPAEGRECPADHTQPGALHQDIQVETGRKEGLTDGDQQEPRAEQFLELLRKKEVGSLSQEGKLTPVLKGEHQERVAHSREVAQKAQKRTEKGAGKMIGVV